MPGTLSKLGERALLARIARRFKRQPRHVLLGPGDDAALLKVPPGKILVASQDDLAEGTHFRRDWAPPGQVASKLLGSAASDLAAMGDVSALGAMVSAGFPPGISASWCQGFLSGVARASRRIGIPVVGGNLARAEKLFFSASVFGAASRDRIIKRSGARVGDLLAGVGPLGEAAAGLALIRGAGVPFWGRELARAFWAPEPLFSAGSKLVGLATSLMDNSDGLWSTARTLAEASGTGMRLDLSQAPASAALKRFCRERRLELKAHQLSGGEDYGLVFTVPPGSWGALRRRLPRAYLLGRVSGRGISAPGISSAIAGFEHFSPRAG